MLKLDPVALTDVGRKRDHNEDYLGDLLIKSGRSYGPEKLAEKGYLFAVADGMGGHAAGEVASELAITTLFEQYYNAPGSGNLATDLAHAVSASNLKVHQEGNSSGRGQMGTTLTLALLKGNRALVGNVGDSRTYLIRQGVPLRVTRDHSLVQDQIDIGALTPEQAEHSLIRNVITRAIGHRDEVDADFFEQELQQGDVLLLCSDGLHTLVKEPEMGAVVASAPALKEAAQNLIDLANERGGSDNISVVLIKVTELGEALPTFLSEGVTTRFSPIGQNTSYNGAVDSGRGKASKLADAPTDRFVPMGKGTTITDFDNRPTVPSTAIGSSVVQAAPVKESRIGAWLISLAVLIVIVGGALLYLLVLNPSSNTATPTPQPAVTTTSAATTSGVTTSAVTTAPIVVKTLPTVTPGLTTNALSNPRVVNETQTPVIGSSNGIKDTPKP